MNGSMNPPMRTGVFRKEGEYWTIACEGRLIRIRHLKGLGYLSRLVRAPERRFHIDELLGAAAARPDSAEEQSQRPADRRRVAVTKAIRSALRKISEHDPLLGERLQAAVHTGIFCSYVPDEGCPPSWEVGEP